MNDAKLHLNRLQAATSNSQCNIRKGSSAMTEKPLSPDLCRPHALKTSPTSFSRSSSSFLSCSPFLLPSLFILDPVSWSVSKECKAAGDMLVRVGLRSGNGMSNGPMTASQRTERMCYFTFSWRYRAPRSDEPTLENISSPLGHFWLEKGRTWAFKVEIFLRNALCGVTQLETRNFSCKFPVCMTFVVNFWDETSLLRSWQTHDQVLIRAIFRLRLPPALDGAKVKNGFCERIFKC